MSVDVRVPSMGESVKTATIARWRSLNLRSNSFSQSKAIVRSRSAMKRSRTSMFPFSRTRAMS